MLRTNCFLKEIVEERYDFFSKHYYKYKSLTAREKEILFLVSRGHSNKGIADQLCITLHTVKTHRKNICRKLETGRLIDLIRYAEAYMN